MDKKEAKNANSLLNRRYDKTGFSMDSNDILAVRTEDIISRWNNEVIEFQAHLTFLKNLPLKRF